MGVCDVIEKVRDIAYNIIYTPKKGQVAISVHRDLVGEVSRRLNDYELEYKYPRRGVIVVVKVKV